MDFHEMIMLLKEIDDKLDQIRKLSKLEKILLLEEKQK